MIYSIYTSSKYNASLQSGTIAAKAAFLNGELLKSGGGAGVGMSLPRKMNPSAMKAFTDDMHTVRILHRIY